MHKIYVLSQNNIAGLLELFQGILYFGQKDVLYPTNQEVIEDIQFADFVN